MTCLSVVQDEVLSQHQHASSPDRDQPCGSFWEASHRPQPGVPMLDAAAQMLSMSMPPVLPADLHHCGHLGGMPQPHDVIQE